MPWVTVRVSVVHPASSWSCIFSLCLHEISGSFADVLSRYLLYCVIVAEEEFSVFGSSGSLHLSSLHEPRHRQSVNDSQRITFSRFYRSASSDSNASNDSTESTDSDSRTRSQSSLLPRSIFYLEQSLSGEQASAAGPTVFSDTGKSSKLSSSAKFQNLLEVMFGCHENSSHLLEDGAPERHRSLGNFVVPKGSFGSAVLPHVSSFR